ncbi:RNA-binding protein 7 [Pyxicephalus adspersus]|uniref:RRM domain-containing protein n=1 Tax=Pyxicephalus adspersus TaxID=30357 RepID=A0AAV2ZP00_PYXAD|nr:TPA: hypothetical protein GDO54_003608 [Pyxicephalus adspersus]
MGADVADRTLFVGNLHPKATEELLFELFLQAGPAVSVRIPKDKDGKPKMFAFVNFKHEESVPYGMSLLNGTKLFGRPLKIQYRSGSSHIAQDTNSQIPQENTTFGNGQASNGNRYDINEEPMNYSDPLPAPSYQRSYSSPENFQRQAVINSFYKQESTPGSRQLSSQPPTPPSVYSQNNSWYNPSSSHATPRRYDSPPGHRNSVNVTPSPYANYRKRDAREVEEDHFYRSHGQEEHYRSHGQEDYNYRSRGQERVGRNLRKDPRWGLPHH